jgi:hypothetical protein
MNALTTFLKQQIRMVYYLYELHKTNESNERNEFDMSYETNIAFIDFFFFIFIKNVIK